MSTKNQAGVEAAIHHPLQLLPLVGDALPEVGGVALKFQQEFVGSECVYRSPWIILTCGFYVMRLIVLLAGRSWIVDRGIANDETRASWEKVCATHSLKACQSYVSL